MHTMSSIYPLNQSKVTEHEKLIEHMRFCQRGSNFDNVFFFFSFFFFDEERLDPIITIVSDIFMM